MYRMSMRLRQWIQEHPEPVGKVIDLLAAELGVTHEAVRQWVYKRRRVPAGQCKRIERYTGGMVSASEMRPDIFAEPEDAA